VGGMRLLLDTHIFLWWMMKAGFETLPITAEHAQLTGQWLQPHRDPFDRMLAAQAKIEKMTLVSVDL